MFVGGSLQVMRTANGVLVANQMVKDDMHKWSSEWSFCEQWVLEGSVSEQ